jgi:hypothetical protein
MTTPQLVFMRVAGPNLSGGIAGNNFTYNVPGLAGECVAGVAFVAREQCCANNL